MTRGERGESAKIAPRRRGKKLRWMLRGALLIVLIVSAIRFEFFPGRPETLEQWWGLPNRNLTTSAESAASVVLDEAEPVTYCKDVAPILWKRCAPCHRPGEVAPFSLLTYQDAAKRADFIAEVVDRRQMPPSKAEPGFGDFVNQPRLTDREIALIARWAELGRTEGNTRDLPLAPTFPAEEWRLGTPDVVLAMSESFAVHGGGDDISRAFVLPLTLEHDQEIIAFEFQPGNRRIVHHAKIFLDPTDDSSRRDRQDPLAGFESVGVSDLGGPALFEWTPGTVAWTPPAGVGQVLKAHGHLVLFIHYHPAGKPETDRSRVGVYFAKRPFRARLAGVPLGTTKIDIPPGARGHEVTVSTTLPADVRVFGLLPHGHFLLRDLRLRAVLPDGTIERMLWIKDWDFNWQGRYQFRSPLFLPRGTRLDLIGSYDNTADNPQPEQSSAPSSLRPVESRRNARLPPSSRPRTPRRHRRAP